MRILLDESLPRKLAFALAGHEVKTVAQMSWNGVVNGELLKRTSLEFDVLITGDQNMQYQQNANELSVSVVVLVAKNNKLESFLPLVGKLLNLLEKLPPRSFTRLSA
jgi:PIN like domain